MSDEWDSLDSNEYQRRLEACGTCHGSGWIPGVAGDGPLDEFPCPECSAPSR